MGCHFLFQGIFPTQGSNPGLLHCRQILYWLSYDGRPWKGLWSGWILKAVFSLFFFFLLVLKTHWVGFWKLFFCFPKGGTVVKLVVSPLPTVPGLIFWEHSLSKFILSISLENVHRVGNFAGLAFGVLGMTKGQMKRSLYEVIQVACGLTSNWSSEQSQEEPHSFNTFWYSYLSPSQSPPSPESGRSSSIIGRPLCLTQLGCQAVTNCSPSLFIQGELPPGEFSLTLCYLRGRGNTGKALLPFLIQSNIIICSKRGLECLLGSAGLSQNLSHPRVCA